MGKFEEAAGTIDYGDLVQPILIKGHGEDGFHCAAFKGLRAVEEFCECGGCRACPFIDASQYDNYDAETATERLGLTTPNDFENVRQYFYYYNDKTKITLPTGCPHAFTDEFNKAKDFTNGFAFSLATRSRLNCVPVSWRLRRIGDKISLTVQHAVYFSPVDSLLLSEERMFQTLSFNVKTGKTFISDIHFSNRHLACEKSPIANVTMSSELAEDIYSSIHRISEQHMLFEKTDQALRAAYRELNIDVSGWDNIINKNSRTDFSFKNAHFGRPRRRGRVRPMRGAQRQDVVCNMSMLVLRNRFPGMHFKRADDYFQFARLVWRSPIALRKKVFSKIPRTMTSGDLLNAFCLPNVKSLRKLIGTHPELISLLFELGFYNVNNPNDINNAVKAFERQKKSSAYWPQYRVSLFTCAFNTGCNDDNLTTTRRHRHYNVIKPWIKAMCKKHGSKAAFSAIAESGYENFFDDILRMLEVLNDAREDWTTLNLPLNLKKQHDMLVDKINSLNKKQDVSYDYLYKDKEHALQADYSEYSFRLISSRQDLQEYGRQMHNCVGSYAHDVENKQCVIVKMLKEGNPFACIEVASQRGKTDSKWAMLQCFGKCNSRFDDTREHSIVQKWMEEKKIVDSSGTIRGARHPYQPPQEQRFHHIEHAV